MRSEMSRRWARGLAVVLLAADAWIPGPGSASQFTKPARAAGAAAAVTQLFTANPKGGGNLCAPYAIWCLVIMLRSR